MPLGAFRYILAVDFEFEFGGHTSVEEAGRSGERPRPVCCVAKELRSGQVWRLRRDEFGPNPPFPIGRDTVLVAHYASAEVGCFLELGWPQPQFILDTFVEFRALTNGRSLPHGASLAGALLYFGEDIIDIAEKTELRGLILRGGPWSAGDWEAILNYCQADVQAMERLLGRLLPRIDPPRALLRGRYMRAVATPERNGIPMDTESLALLRRQWNNIEDELIRAIDVDYGVYEGRSFREHRFAQWSAAQGIPWPRLETGHLDMADDTFRQMARAYPAVSPLRELRSSLSDLRLEDLAVGRDGFNRTILSCFRARSGRNAPSNTRYIFGPSVWLRNLIKPPPGYGVAYVDWQQQEHGIAGALSGDAALQAAYVSGDPYLEFARQAGAVPPDATKHSHPNERELFKQCTLAVAYGMGAQGLARRINCIPIVSRDLLRAHQETYRQFWRWSDAAVDHAVLTGTLTATFGWPIHVGEGFNPRSLRNFPMQANGAEMLRLATCYAVEAGLGVAALVHDAILIMAPADSLEADVAAVRGCMARASRDVLAGFELRTDATLIFHPDRYHDPRGAQMWRRVIELAATWEAAQHGAA